MKTFILTAVIVLITTQASFGRESSTKQDNGPRPVHTIREVR